MTQEIIGLSTRMIVLDSRPYIFKLILEKVLLDGVFSDCYSFPLAESFRRAPHSSPYTCCFLPEEQTCEVWEASKSDALSEVGEH
jgi:hypothetical protein